MPERADYDSVLNHRLLLPLPPILRPPVLFIVGLALYGILVLPLSIALLGENGTQTALVAGSLAACITWMLLRSDGQVNSTQRYLLSVAVSILGGAASVVEAWIFQGQEIMWTATTKLVWAVSIALTAASFSGFGIGIVGIAFRRGTGIIGLLASQTLTSLNCALLLVIVYVVGSKETVLGDMPRWKIGTVGVSAVLVSQLCAVVGWYLGRGLRRFLGASEWIWRGLCTLGPPLGLFATGYFFLGILFGTFHAAIWASHSDAYKLNGTSGGLGRFIYFSFVTIATVGYGDITPITGFARFVTILEIVLGQFWTLLILGVVLSRLSSWGQEPTGTSDKANDGDKS